MSALAMPRRRWSGWTERRPMYRPPSSSFQSTAPTIMPPSSTTAPPPSARSVRIVSAVSCKALGGGWVGRDWVANARRISPVMAAASEASAVRTVQDGITQYRARSATGLIDVEYIPQIGDLARGIAAHHEHVGLAPREQTAGDGARPDGVGRARGAGHDGLRVGEARLSEHVDLVNELTGSIPAPRGVGACRHEHAGLAHLAHGVDAHVERPPPRLELRFELRGEPALALARLALALDARFHDVESGIDPGFGGHEELHEIGPEAIGAVGFREDAVDDHVHAGIEAVLDGLRRGAVSGRELAVPPRLVGHGGELGYRVRGAVGI